MGFARDARAPQCIAWRLNCRACATVDPYRPQRAYIVRQIPAQPVVCGASEKAFTRTSWVISRMRSLNLFKAAAAVAVLAATNVAAARAESPFAELAGTWSGSGTARFDGGKTESLRCKGYYTTSNGPQNLGLSIRCANASAKVELRASLNYSNGAITGNWEERTYNQSGTVSGRASANKLNLAISGGIDGSMSVSIAGNTHTVNVSTSGPSLKAINISMSR